MMIANILDFIFRPMIGAVLLVLLLLPQAPVLFAEEVPAPPSEATASEQPAEAPSGEEVKVEALQPVAATQPQNIEVVTPAEDATQQEASAEAVQPRPFSFPQSDRIERPETGMAVLNFSEASLRDILRTVAEITKENFILAPGVNARISVQTTKPVPKKDVFGIFESLLEMNGLSAVKTGAYYKIVPAASARQRGLGLATGKDPESIPSGDRVMNLVVPVEFVSSGDIALIIKPMLSQTGSVVNLPKSNTLIITDTASNLKSALEMISTLDVDAFKRMNISIIPVKNVDIKILNKELSEIMAALGFGKDSTQLAVVPIERLNSLTVFSSSPELLSSVKEWITKLDETPAGEGPSMHIYYVQNDKASNIKNLLDQVFNGRKITASAAVAAQTTSYQPSAAPAAVATVQANQFRSETGNEDVKIFLYEPNNALIILSSGSDYQNILTTVKELDRPPKQVLIDALVAEVQLDEGTKYGIQWSALTGNVNIQQNTGIVSSVLDSPKAAITAPIGAVAPTGLAAFATDASKFFAVVQALATTGKVNVLSNPHIVVKNYEKASINVGSDEPVATQSTQTAVTGTAGLIQTIEYRKTGVILTVLPQITEGGMVAMSIRQEVSDKSTDRTVGNAIYPSFTKREAETSVVAKDRETLVIGGLIRGKNDSTSTGIPVLSSIPFIGNLFKFTSKNDSKTELVILLTPTVISNTEQATSATVEFKNKLGGLKEMLKQKNYGK